jgi:hypothetical protein
MFAKLGSNDRGTLVTIVVAFQLCTVADADPNVTVP